MRSFFKIFFASLLSLVIFSLICLFLLIALVGTITSKDRPDIPSKSVLVIDLGKTYREQMDKDILNGLSDEGNTPGLYDVIRLLHYAKTDRNISGVFIQADQNVNGFASSNELRNALLDFRESKKF